MRNFQDAFETRKRLSVFFNLHDCTFNDTISHLIKYRGLYCALK